MGKQFNEIKKAHKKFIELQKIFFVGTAASIGRVNVSPKGMDSLRIISSNKIVWLNYTGSGNETAAHLLQNPRMTIMWCSFDERPEIIRVYGKAQIFHDRDSEFDKYLKLFNDADGARQIIELEIDLVQTSCGFAVPIMEFKQERHLLKNWSHKKGKDGIKDYWENRNTKSIDGFDTKILD